MTGVDRIQSGCPQGKAVVDVGSFLIRIVVVGYREKVEADFMKFEEQFCDSTYADQIQLAERELSAFIRAVTQLFGSEEAKLSASDWLDESELMDCPPLSTSRNWRAVTIAAAARLANRLAVAQHQRTLLVASADTKVPAIPSSNCLAFTLLI
jgi:hypothetical protein